MPKSLSRSQFFKQFPAARSFAALDAAVNANKKVTPGALKLQKGQFKGKTAVVIGSGVGGLTTAYELLARDTGMEVIVLEALNRTGGRCLSLRTGDTLTEDQDRELFGSKPGKTQVVRFDRPHGDAEPYLNAGPGRIPSSHKRLLSYLQQFSVDVEVYVMNSESNMAQMKDGPVGKEPLVYRRLDHNMRGWLAQMVYENADQLIADRGECKNKEEISRRADALRDLMVTFGELVPSGDNEGQYVVTAGDDGLENGRSRAGYTVLPGVQAGRIAEALSFNSLLDSEFWKKTKFYQPADFLWQATMFQPVGGMDRVQHAFAQQVSALGGTIHLNSPVDSVSWDAGKQKFRIAVNQVGTDAKIEYEADYVFSNAAMPFLKKLLDDDLNPDGEESKGLDKEFRTALRAVFKAQFDPSPEHVHDNGFKELFLACTTKVGWQGRRQLWQGSGPTTKQDPLHNVEYLAIDDSEVGVVPIFGGISWTDDDITQIWYPSCNYHDEKGVLTGAYNFGDIAWSWGETKVDERLTKAREGAALFGKAFGAGLEHGVAIAWQNMPHIKGGWAQWHTVDQAETHFNVLTQGAGIYEKDGELSDPRFFVVGDQVSSLPGWQEGAIVSALHALSRLARPDLAIPHLKTLPDTRLMVEGI